MGTFSAGNVGASVTKLRGPAVLAAISVAGLFDGLTPGGWRTVPVLYSILLAVMAAVVWFASPTPQRTPGAGRGISFMMMPVLIVRVWRFGWYYVVVIGAHVSLSR